jgi:hypothetical protein
MSSALDRRVRVAEAEAREAVRLRDQAELVATFLRECKGDEREARLVLSFLHHMATGLMGPGAEAFRDELNADLAAALAEHPERFSGTLDVQTFVKPEDLEAVANATREFAGTW